MIDNFQLIFPHLNWVDDKTFFFCQILKRKKDNNDMGADNKLLKDIYFDSPEKFWDKEQEIKDFCKFFNARAYIYLNRRDTNDIALECLDIAIDRIICNAQRSLRSVYATACGRKQSDPNKKWVVDIDSTDSKEINFVKSLVDQARPEGNKILFELPTPNGLHLITKPFDPRDLKEALESQSIEFSIQKKQPTVLFVP